jgi:hypothetical protein
MANEQTFLVLNAVYLKKLATAEQVSSMTGIRLDAVEKVLEDATNRAWSIKMNGQNLLAPEGTQVVLEHYREAYAPLRADPALEAWYARFEAANTQFIKYVSEWQASGDERALGRLLRTVERLIKSLAEITPMLPRYEGYVRRFERGLALIDQGQLDYVAKPTIDSVHNIWFEFHEDILSVLGQPRDT